MAPQGCRPRPIERGGAGPSFILESMAAELAIQEREIGMEKIPGIFDMHIHSAPDIAPRKTDDLELAKAAAAAGMGGIMIKY